MSTPVDPSTAIPAGHLRLQDLVVRYPASGGRNALVTVVDGLSLHLERGEIGCLLGASGCGKTTVLRAIAGFVRPDAGRIEMAGITLSGPGHDLRGESRKEARIHFVPPEQRHMGMVFQDFALFPHLNVAQNLAFGISAGPGRLEARERGERVQELLALTRLESLADRYPHQLSGGQQQRVALARALAPRPSLMLLDEPFSSLDVELRVQLSLEVREILRAAQTTALLVTHDQNEAFAISDRIAVMHQGRIEQWDTPYRLYHEPATRHVADFVGEGAFLPGERTDAETGDHAHVRTELGFITQPDRCSHPHRQAYPVDVLLRPDDVVHDDSAPLKGVVRAKAFRGADFLYTLALPSGREVLALVPSHHDHAIGEAIGIRLEAEHVVTFEGAKANRPAPSGDHL